MAFDEFKYENFIQGHPVCVCMSHSQSGKRYFFSSFNMKTKSSDTHTFLNVYALKQKRSLSLCRFKFIKWNFLHFSFQKSYLKTEFHTFFLGSVFSSRFSHLFLLLFLSIQFFRSSHTNCFFEIRSRGEKKNEA